MPHWADENRWDVVYARCFKNQPEGHALYKKFTATELRAGTCGYFDEQGDWYELADLTDQAALDKAGLKHVDGITVSQDPSGEKWPFRKSEHVRKIHTGGNAQAA